MTLPTLDASAIEAMTPEQYSEYIVRLSREVPLDALVALRKEQLRVIAAEADGYENYVAYHELIHGAPPLKHEPIREAFAAHQRGEMFLELGFRGSHKTTTFDVTLGSFLIGHHPDGTGVITGANDSNAKLIAKSLAQIIELHPEFKAVFPNILIYKERGWGAEGYWVRNGKLELSEWTAQQAKVNDPTFVGGGYKSSEINGKHPSLFLFVDDLHDIDSSGSVTEREYIKMVFFNQILPTVIRAENKLQTWVILTGVPFSKDDTYHVLMYGGDCKFVIVPVMRRAAVGATGAVYVDGIHPKTGALYDDLVGWWYLTWPENFGLDAIFFWRTKGKSTFHQMFMIDIETAKTQGLKYYLYDHKKIGFDLPTGGGADPTSIDPDHEVGGQKRSSFALAYLCNLNDGRLVLKGGVLKQMGFNTAKDAMRQAQSMFTNWLGTRVEGVGVGKAFQQFLRLFPTVRWIDSNIADPQGKIKDKKMRIEAEVAPWLENGVILISDDENDEYCMAVRFLCDNFFDMDAKKPHEALDAGDGFYHACKHFPQVLREYVTETMNPDQMLQQQRRGLYHPLAGRR